MDACLQQIFSLVIGVVFVFICGFIGKWLAGNLIGMGGTLASQITDSFLKAASVILAVIGAVFAIVLHKQDAQKRIQTNKIALIVFSALQALLLLMLFFGGRIIISLYLGAIGGGAYNAVIISTLRTTAIPMLIASVVATAYRLYRFYSVSCGDGFVCSGRCPRDGAACGRCRDRHYAAHSGITAKHQLGLQQTGTKTNRLYK